MPEPPDETLEDLQERLRAARQYRDDAANLLVRLRAHQTDNAADVEELPAPERRLYLTIEIDLAERRLIRWGVRIERLAAIARAMGAPS
jgi:hypothetical protein